MSNKLLKACSVLPVFAVCGMISTFSVTSASAAIVDVEEGMLFENQKNEVKDERAGALTISYGDSLSSNGVNGVTFKANSSVNSGGAMKALNGFTAGDNWSFEGNTSDKISGGLYVKIPESENSDRNVSFGNNTTFKGNSSKWLGGALGIETAENFVMGDGALFEENSTDADGGAVAIWTDKSNGVTVGSNLTLGQSVFKGNTAANRGGAIANLNNDEAENKTDFYNTVNIGANSVFASNSAKTGGAIYNMGTMSIADGTEFISNSSNLGAAIFNTDSGVITEISNALFQGNKAESYKDADASLTGDVYAQGGAIYNLGKIGAVTGDFSNNTVHTKSETASKATANGGALALYQSTIESITGDFTGNAAIAEIVGESKDYSDEMVSGDKLVSAGGGAIHIEGKWATGDTTKIGSIDGDFVANSATGDAYANGGAIYIKAGPNTDVSIDEINGNFVNNKVVAVTDNDDISKTSTGGAISIKEASGKKATVAVIGNFTGNSVSTNATNAFGGAVYNEGDFTVNGTFQNNTVASNKGDAFGGAIYNSGSVTFNGDTLFANNTANGVANDIHNDGTLNIASGTTTINGGITGAGSLTIAEGATMNIGTATVQQNSINLNGTLAAQILNANSFGKVQVSDITVGENGLLDLVLGAAGTYDFGTIVPVENIAYNDAVYKISFDENNAMVVSTKAVEEIAADAGLSTTTAGVVAALANADNDVLNSISLRAQQDLAAGNTKRVEAETAKLNPDDKPVAQAVATSVQNQVLSLAAGRMSGASVGRSGGDLADADYGVWVQGLYNHSKYNGKFSGNTSGISVGADTLIDGKYTLGIGYAYNDTDVDSTSRDTAIESNSVFVYGQYKPAEWYVNAALNYTMSDYTETSDPYGVVYESKYDVNSFGGQIAAGYDFAFGLTPELSVRYLNVSQDAYDALLGHVDAADANYLTGSAGVKYAFEIKSDSELKLRPELRAAATYDFLSDAAIATITAPGNLSYVLDAERLSRLGGEFGLGLSAQYRGLEVSLNYDLDVHEDYTSQTGMLKFRYDF